MTHLELAKKFQAIAYQARAALTPPGKLRVYYESLAAALENPGPNLGSIFGGGL